MSNARKTGRPEKVLGEGAILEQLRRQGGVAIDPHIANTALLFDAEWRLAMRRLVEAYLAIAREAGYPFLLTTPTWRAQPDRVERSRWRGTPVNRAGVAFAREIRESSGADAEIAGLIGSRGDCYRPQEAPDEMEARAYHRAQVMELAEAGVDWVLAATLPSLAEARGIASLASEAGVPVTVSFVLGPEGRLLDGRSLDEAIERIGSPVMLNCTHWSFARMALENLKPDRVPMVLGLHANTAACHPLELEGSAELRSETPDAFAAGMEALARDFGLRILGGCCGTSPSHMRALARRLRDAATGP